MNNFFERRYIIAGIFIVLILTLLGRLFYLQIVDDRYLLSAQGNVLRRIYVNPARGPILDRNGKILVQNQAFYDTPGLHAASCVLLAFVRILFISITVQKDGFDNEPEPTLSIMGIRWFFTYALILTLFHHFFLFNLEVFRLSEIPYTLSRFVLSSIFTVFLMLLTGFLFFRRKERK